MIKLGYLIVKITLITLFCSFDINDIKLDTHDHVI